MIKLDKGIEAYGVKWAEYRWGTETLCLNMIQTNGCTYCNKAYAETGDFICPDCSQHMGPGDWKDAVDWEFEKHPELNGLLI